MTFKNHKFNLVDVNKYTLKIMKTNRLTLFYKKYSNKTIAKTHFAVEFSSLLMHVIQSMLIAHTANSLPLEASQGDTRR